MKKVIRPIFVLAMLLALVGSVSAGKTAKPIEFTIDGDTTYWGRVVNQDECTLKFKDLTAAGTVTDDLNVSFDLNGSFTYVEKGEIDFCTAAGSNKGVMTIVTDKGTLVIKFKGQTDLQLVWGVWKLKSATGDYAGIKGAGTYSGDAAPSSFVVTFYGSFYPDPH